MSADGEKNKEIFCICKEQIGKGKNGNFTYWKGTLNVDGVWSTVVASATKAGDIMLKFYPKK